MIKAIFYDFDGVLTLNENGTSQTCQYISKTMNLNFKDVLKAHYEVGLELLLGTKSYKDVLPRLNELIGKEVDTKILQEAFLSTPLNTEMFKLVEKYKNKGLYAGIITDNSIERFETLNNKYKFNEIFNPIVVSAQIGQLKDENVIFERALDFLNLNPENVIYIDNSKRNLEKPYDMGMKTIFFDDKANNIKSLTRKINSYLH